MIIVSMKGGLGNQLYQYAFGLFLSERYKAKLVLDTTYFNIYPKVLGVTYRKFELDKIFKTNQDNISFKPMSFGKSKLFYHLINQAIRLKYRAHLVNNNLILPEAILQDDKNVYLNGYFQREYHRSFIQSQILPIIRYDFIYLKEYKSLVDQISHTQSVSIHVRRGDYLNVVNRKYQGICSEQYYKNAISYIQGKLSSPNFFVFSDDIEWCMEMFKNLDNMFFVNINKGENSYRDIILMSLCNHNIVANSTFSEWGAMLNTNANKLVLVPKKWKSNLIENTIAISTV